MLVGYLRKARPAAVLMIYAASLCLFCDRSLARLYNISRNRAFWRRFPNLMHSIVVSYGGLLRTWGSNLTPSKSTFNAENYMRRLSWSI